MYMYNYAFITSYQHVQKKKIGGGYATHWRAEKYIQGFRTGGRGLG
jgi:hypothetical protein